MKEIFLVIFIAINSILISTGCKYLFDSIREYEYKQFILRSETGEGFKGFRGFEF